MTIHAVRTITQPATSAIDTHVTARLSSAEFEAGVRFHLPSLRKRALRLTGDAEAADDLLQDTLERGYRKRALFQPGTDLRAWLLSIMRNVWISTYRRRASDPGLLSLDALDEAFEHRGLPVSDEDE